LQVVTTNQQPCVIAIDAGTTGVRSRAVFPGSTGSTVSSYREFTQHFPEPGWVEHDALEIWEAVRATLHDVIDQVGTPTAIGITNQRETVLAWNRRTGQPYGTAIVWQDRRTAGRCDQLAADGHLPQVRAITGLVLDPYFSGTKAAWLLQHRDIPIDDDLAIGTIDTWLLWNLTGGEVFATDPSNASRTMLFDIHRGQWDDELLALFSIPRRMLPEVRDSSGRIAEVASGLPAAGAPMCVALPLLILPAVMGPTTPSTNRPLARWKALTAASVLAPAKTCTATSAVLTSSRSASCCSR
jgi:glycerol kinase